MGWHSSYRGRTAVLLGPIALRPLLMRMMSNKAWVEANLREFESLEARLEGSTMTTKKRRLYNIKKVISGAKIPRAETPAGGSSQRCKLFPPVEPRESECCGTGCDDCVWTTYWKELVEYEELLLLDDGDTGRLKHYPKAS